MKLSHHWIGLFGGFMLIATTGQCTKSGGGGGASNGGDGGDSSGGGGQGDTSGAGPQGGAVGDGGNLAAGSGGTPTGTGGSAGAGGSVNGGAGGAPFACTPAPKLKLTLVTKTLIPAAWQNTGWKAVPLALTQAKGDPRIFVAQRGGYVRILRNGQLEATPFLDMVASLANIPSGTGGERGLINLALHPNYAANGRFFVFYTGGRNDPYSDSLEGDVVVAEGKRSAANPDRADPVLKPLLIVEHSEDHPNNYDDGHNGGLLAFGKDGFLWTAVGDGGNMANDFGAGQDPNHPLSKIYRLDVNNPPADPHKVSAYVWAGGQRNPWRGSVDAETGDLYIGDVQELHWEEINWLPFGAPKGRNYGWGKPGMEGSHCFPNYVKDCVPFGEMPLYEYAHKETGEFTRPPGGQPPEAITERTAVISGYVYRGGKIPGMKGRFLWGDHGTNVLKSFVNRNGRAECLEDHTADLVNAQTPLRELVGFGEDAERELYIYDMDRGNAGRNSSIYKLEPEN